MRHPSLALFLLALSLTAQLRPAFEVASIKPNPTGPETGLSWDYPANGGFVSRNLDVWNLIRFAYNLRNLQIAGGPDWIKAQGFDIQAQSSAPVPRDQTQKMLQALLEDRFRLKFHRETRQQPAYILTIAAGGHKLAPPGEARNGTIRMGDMDSPNMTIESLCQTLEFELDRHVSNQTGLTGPFAIRLRYASDRAAPGTADPSLPALSTALREQLGLKLDSGRAPVEVFVVDSVEPPSEN